MIFAHILVDLFVQGGPIMWPIALVMLVAVAVVTERVIWWLRASASRQPKVVAQCFAALETGRLAEAETIAGNAPDPILRMVREGLAHREGAFHGALQSAASEELRAMGCFETRSGA